jgi:tRNA 2-selenouridine synthase SelU
MDGKGLEEGGKSRTGETMPGKTMLPKDLPPSEDLHPMAEHRANQMGKRGRKDSIRAAE